MGPVPIYNEDLETKLTPNLRKLLKELKMQQESAAQRHKEGQKTQLIIYLPIKVALLITNVGLLYAVEETNLGSK